jgi:MoaA/NifB/PqqE/SkfB family radical SAM enzyme
MMEDPRFSPLRVLRWHNEITNALRPERYMEFHPRGPIRAILDLTNLCNHSCPWCEPAEYREATIRDKKHTLDTKTAALLIDDLSDMGCKLVWFSGGGEPLLHPDFGELLERAHGKGMRTIIFTNGVRLGDWWHPYVNHGADHIRVSLDASCEAEHIVEHNAKKGDFTKILQNIDFVTRHKRSGRPEIGVSYVMTDKNSSHESIGRILDIAKELSFDYIQFRPVSSAESCLTENQVQILFNTVKIEMERREDNVKVHLLGQRGSDVFHQREFEKCYVSLTLAVIGATGDVQACCDRRDIVFGNIYEKRFKDIWLSPEHRAKANAIVPKFCERCVQCGTNRAIEKFVVHNEALPEIL